MKKHGIQVMLSLVGVLLLLCSCDKTATQSEIVQSQSPAMLEDSIPADSAQDESNVYNNGENADEKADENIGTDKETTETDTPSTEAVSEGFDSFNGTGTEFPDDDSIMTGDTQSSPESDSDAAASGVIANDVPNGTNDVPDSQVTKAPTSTETSNNNTNTSSTPSEDEIGPDNDGALPYAGQQLIGNNPNSPPSEIPQELVDQGYYWDWLEEENRWKLTWGGEGEDPDIAASKQHIQDVLDEHPTFESWVEEAAYNRVWVHYYRDYGVSFDDAIAKIKGGEYADEYQEAYEHYYNNYSGYDYWGIGVGG